MALCILLSAGPGAASFVLLPEPLQQAIRDQNLPPDSVGLWVQRVGDPAPLARLNPHRP
ncbi:MAG: D-alanyl-D-alanine carboxypeptidase/D-alanyl-D-alanine-endopeptidase, partial [Thioalkalivibrio sp.]|nr:D-alanyl-D-alanine carboxypeptidase/D-alanyl-D-alanine-endopeptidase [Thioalkalivibrio sp.]